MLPAGGGPDGGSSARLHQKEEAHKHGCDKNAKRIGRNDTYSLNEQEEQKQSTLARDATL